MAKSYDMVIRGGRLIDGTGTSAKTADIAIRGDTIADVGTLSPAGETPLLEAAGLTIAPGFVDPWAASDPFAPAFAGAESKLRQGVTTEVAGALGRYPFPTLEASPGADELTGALGAPPGWPDARGYLLAVARAGSGIGRAFLAGYGAIRAAVLGPANAPPTRDEGRRIAAHVEASLEAGCIGVAIDLSEPPAAFAGVDEVVDVARQLSTARAVLAVTMRQHGTDLEQALEEILEIGARTGVELVLPEFRIAPAPNWEKVEWVERRLRSAIEDGTSITLVIEPYVAWTGPFASLLPPTAREGGDESLPERLKGGTVRAELLRSLEMRAGGDENYWTRVCPVGLSREKLAIEGQGRLTVADIAASRKRPPAEVYLDLLIERPSRTALFFEMSEANRERLLGLGFVTIGSAEPARPLTDPRVSPPVHPRGRGAFARLIRRYVREKKRLSLEEAIRRLTSFPAERFGLGRRGKVAPGYAADLLLFRPDTIADRATFKNPSELPIGIDHVMVGGRFAVRDGRITGARQGTVIRRAAQG